MYAFFFIFLPAKVQRMHNLRIPGTLISPSSFIVTSSYPPEHLAQERARERERERLMKLRAFQACDLQRRPLDAHITRCAKTPPTTTPIHPNAALFFLKGGIEIGSRYVNTGLG